MPTFCGFFDVDIPFTAAPIDLNCLGFWWLGEPIGGWNSGWRGTVYMQVRNDGASAANVDAALLVASTGWTSAVTADSVSLDPGETGVIFASAEALLEDITYIEIRSLTSTDLVLTGLQLTPFSAEVFWTGVKGCLET